MGKSGLLPVLYAGNTCCYAGALRTRWAEWIEGPRTCLVNVCRSVGRETVGGLPQCGGFWTHAFAGVPGLRCSIIEFRRSRPAGSLVRDGVSSA